MPAPPIILLAFANDRQGRFLRSIAAEQRALKRALSPLGDKKLLQIEELSDATADDIFEAFRKYDQRVKSFHYGGHAQDLSLLLNDAKHALNIEGFAKYLAQQKSLELVFMNGCATAAQQVPLQAAGIPHLILTDTAINDQAAQIFATHFYQNLASGREVARSFAEAEGATQAQLAGDPRGFVKEDAAAQDQQRLPWRLYQTNSANWALSTQKAFPWVNILGALLVVLLLTLGSYGLWRNVWPFDASVPIQYPMGTEDKHFELIHRLYLTQDERELEVVLKQQPWVDFPQMSGRYQQLPIKLESLIWTLADSLLEISANTEAVVLDWKQNLKVISGRILFNQEVLAGVTVSMGSHQILSGQDGSFKIQLSANEVARISHSLSLYKAGYAPLRPTVNLSDGKDIYEFYLQAQ